MKKFIACLALVAVALSCYSQTHQRPPGQPQHPPMADRWTHDSTTIASAISLSGDQSKKIKAAFYSFYKEMDALREKNKDTRPPKEELEKLVKKRDDAVKAVLNKSQSEKYETIKKQLIPPPPQGAHGKPPPPPSKK